MKLFFALLFLLQGLISQAQPVSLSGIVPGKTRLEELHAFLTDVKGVTDGDNFVQLKEINKLAELAIHDGVVYEVKLSLMSNRDVLDALIAKYGDPKNITGSVDRIKCQNGFGATFNGYVGMQTESWPVKEGVVASIEWAATHRCTTLVVPTYYLRHVETFKKIKEKEGAAKALELEKRKDKLKNSL